MRTNTVCRECGFPKSVCPCPQAAPTELKEFVSVTAKAKIQAAVDNLAAEMKRTLRKAEDKGIRRALAAVEEEADLVLGIAQSSKKRGNEAEFSEGISQRRGCRGAAEAIRRLLVERGAE